MCIQESGQTSLLCSREPITPGYISGLWDSGSFFFMCKLISKYYLFTSKTKRCYTIIAFHWVRYDVMEHWKSILTKVEGCGQYCFSVLHNTSYCPKWSAVIVLWHLTYQAFCVYLDRFLGIVCCVYFQIQSPWADPFNIIEHLY